MQEAEAIRRFRARLTDLGLRYTKQREAIAEAFFHSGQHHLTLQEVLDLARAKQSSVGFATVYRTMRLLEECGLATERQFTGGHTRWEPQGEGEHHDHLICIKCGRIVEFEDDEIERRQQIVADRYGFRVTSHRHEVYGECTDGRCEERLEAAVVADGVDGD